MAHTNLLRKHDAVLGTKLGSFLGIRQTTIHFQNFMMKNDAILF